MKTPSPLGSLLTDRRFLISLIAIVLLFVLGYRGMDVTDAMALIAVGIGVANGSEKALIAFANRRKAKPIKKETE
jgi:hypothetical protein